MSQSSEVKNLIQSILVESRTAIKFTEDLVIQS